MKIKITGKELKITEAINNYVEKKLERIDKYFEGADAEVTLRTEKSVQIAEIYVTSSTGEKYRADVSGVFYNRLSNNMPLGSDVTTYYAAKVDMGERDLYQAEIDEHNNYNTRPMSSAGYIPIGPISNPSDSAINAAINYTKNDYFYFVADKNGKVYFSKTDAEHVATIQKLKKEGLWFNYE